MAIKNETEKMPEFNDKNALARFKRAAKKYKQAATASQESARETLFRLGIGD